MPKFILLIISILSGSTMANDVCNTKSFDICKKAREFADEIATILPMQVNKNMSFHKVVAMQNMISISVIYSYDKVALETSLKQAGTSHEDVKKAMGGFAYESICISTPETKAFINLGGAFQYIYKFVDGETYTVVTIDSC